MANINEYEVTIVGFNPLLINRLSNDLNKEIKKVERAKIEEWEEENYEKKLYKDNEGKVIIPDRNILSLLQDCAKKYQISPPKQIGRTWTAYIKGAIIMKEVFPLKYSKIEKFGTMVNGNPSSNKKSSKVYRVRPMIHNWKLTFVFQDSANYLKKDIVEDILKTGGLLVGLGDWRPQFGRFKVESIKMNTIEV